MSTLTLNDDTISLLRNQHELTEIQDAQGRMVGFFTPMAGTKRFVPGRKYTTQEVFEVLKAHAKDEKTRNYLQAKIDGLKERHACAAP
jgi:hypothetical protein